MLGIIDYGLSNMGAIKAAINKIGKKYILIKEVKDFSKATKLILPGVGSYKKGVQNLKNLNFFETIKYEVKINKKPILGICLGMQLLSERGTEQGESEGLGLIQGKVVKLKTNEPIPHTGWNKIKILKKSKLIENIPENTFFYFIHSFYFLPKKKEDRVAITNHGMNFTSIIEQNNVFGIQAHPEKSQIYGLDLLKNFLIKC